MKAGSKIRQVEDAVARSGDAKASVPLLSTGSTLLNLACSGSHRGGFMAGSYYFLVGDSTSGKTFLSMSCFAESTISRAFRDYRLIYDNIEDGCHMDLERLFNKKVADKWEPPGGDRESPDYSTTVEEFYDYVDDAVKDGRPFVYVLDSMDALETEAEEKKSAEQKDARRKGKDAKGTYGLDKPKLNSQNLRRVLKGLKRTGSILIIISQTRDKIDSFGYGDKKTRAGGHSLKFYATAEIWTSVVGSYKRTVRGKTRKIGVQVQARIKKNRQTGKMYQVLIPIYPSYGIDDAGACVDYLIEEKWWKKSSGVIKAPELEMEASRDDLVRAILQAGMLKKLREVVAQCWKEIDDACRLDLTNRYAVGSS